jgi:hypothetical protein
MTENAQSTGAMPLGLSGPYPIAAPLRAAGYLWRDEFRNLVSSQKQGLVVTGAPSFAGGIVLNGSSQYGTYTNVAPMQAFSTSQHFWLIGFAPDFEADDDTEHVLFDAEDADVAGSTVYGVRKNADNTLRITHPGTNTDIALVDYQGEWNVGVRNTMIVNVGKTGGTEVLLNATQVDQTSVLFAAQGAGTLHLGVDNDQASGYFDGTIYRLAFGLGELAAADVTVAESD